MSDCKEHGSDWMDLVSMSPDGSGCDEICWLCYTLNQLNDAGKTVFAAHTRQAKADGFDEGVRASGLDLDYILQLLDTNPYRSQP